MSSAEGEVAYYPGCALEGSAKPYDRSTRKVVEALGLEMEEVDDWNCCGAGEVKNVDPMLQTYLSSRNLAIAKEEMGYDTVMAPCNGCYHNLKEAEYDLQDEEKLQTAQELAQEANDPVYSGDTESLHLLEWIMRDLGSDGVEDKVEKPLDGLKVANYYGCMYTRPQKITPYKDQAPDVDSSWDPHFMDDILEAAGAESVDFRFKTDCCGGPHSVSDAETSTELVLKILQGAEEAGADVIATECPTCHSSLEMHQARAEKELGVETDVSMIYFTQLLGLALGLPSRKLAVEANISDSVPLLKEKGIL